MDSKKIELNTMSALRKILLQEITLQKRKQLQAALQFRIASILSESINIETVSNNILKVICELMSFSKGEVWALDSNEKVMRYVSGWTQLETSVDTDVHRQNREYHQNEGFVGHIWKINKSWWSNRLPEDARHTQESLLLEKGINCCFGFPLLFAKKVMGVILLYGINLKKPDTGLKIVFEVIGKQIGTFFKHRYLENELLYIANHDVLTGLMSRYHTESALKNMINTEKKRKNRSKIAFLYFDLDYFKNINDTLGHSKGDQILQEIAHRLKKITRETDLIARFGGDEFVIILPDILHKDDINAIIKKIMASIKPPFMINKKEYYLSASMGISIYPDDGDNIEQLFKAADLAMYKVKRSNRGGYLYATSNTGLIEKRQLLLISQLHHAAQHNEFILYYQPIVNIQTHKIIGVEALLRWKKPNGKIINPDVFIPLLEQTNLILPVGQWILRTACTQMKNWEKLGLNSISVNISVRQLDNKLMALIKKVLEETQLSPNKLTIEVTESMLMHQTLFTINLLNKLNELGMQIAIDDFGTGYSSFSYLKDFKVNALKIDQSFIADIGVSGRSEAIITAIIVMAHALGLKTIAEGVETKKQLRFLEEQACDEYQGFFMSKPLLPKQLQPLISSIKR